MAADRRQNFYINWKEVCVPQFRVESLLLTRTIQDTMYPRLLREDLTIFDTLIADHFVDQELVKPDNSYLESVIVKIIQEMGLVKWQPQVQVVFQLTRM